MKIRQFVEMCVVCVRVCALGGGGGGGTWLIGLVTISFMFKFLFGRKDDLTQKTSKIDFYWDMV